MGGNVNNNQAGDTHTPEGEESDPDWERFVKVLGMSEEDRVFLEQSAIVGHQFWYEHCKRALDKSNNNTSNIQGDNKDINEEACIFEFDSGNKIAPNMRLNLFKAWKWLELNINEIDDDDAFFLRTFKRGKFLSAVRKEEKRKQEKKEKEKSKRLKLTEPNQASASCFTAAGSRTLEGMASLPSVYYPHLVSPQVKTWFTDEFEVNFEADKEAEEKATDTIAIAKLLDGFIIHGSGHRLKVVPDTMTYKCNRCVKKQHLDEIAIVLDGPMTTEGVFKDGIANLGEGTRRTLGELGLTHGIANSNSFPDGYFHTKPIRGLPSSPVNFLTTSMLECKDTAAAPLAGTGEVIANATAAAVAMLRQGIPFNNVVVPILTTSGRMVQVAAVYMLEPSLPAVCFLSNNMDLANEDHATKVARIILAMAKHADKIETFVRTGLEKGTLIAKPDIDMRFDNEKYHVKLIKNFFSCCGPSLVESSILRLLAITSKIADMKDSICLPIAIRLSDAIYKEDVILFDKLVDFKIGLPATTLEDRKALVAKIELVVAQMHSKGVVHMDLFLSNIMWKKENDGTFSVRIIDFDSVHKLGCPLEDCAFTAIRDHNGGIFGKLGAVATKEHDTLYIQMLKSNIDHPKLRDMHMEDTDSCHVDCIKRRLDAQCTVLIQKTVLEHLERH